MEIAADEIAQSNIDPSFIKIAGICGPSSQAIKEIASEINDDIIVIRRHLHQNPELSFREYETSAFIKRSLDELEIPWFPVADTGVIATIEGQSSHISDAVIPIEQIPYCTPPQWRSMKIAWK